jgi:hypothetical protein
MDPPSMNYRALQKACKSVGLPDKGKTEVLRELLEEYLKDPDAARSRIEKAKEEATEKKAEAKKTARKGWINWKKSAAREIMWEDLETGGWLCGKEEDARIVFELYQERQIEFKDVPFSQFEERYNEAIQKAQKRRARAAEEDEWMKHDRMIFPRQTHNERGEPVFDMDEKAKKQLREDVKRKLHKAMPPSELWEGRSVYQKYKLRIFRPRIYQEVRRQKYLNYYEKKRKAKRLAFEAQQEKEAARRMKAARRK